MRNPYSEGSETCWTTLGFESRSQNPELILCTTTLLIVIMNASEERNISFFLPSWVAGSMVFTFHQYKKWLLETKAWYNVLSFPKDFYPALRFRVQNLTRRCEVHPFVLLKLFPVNNGFGWLAYPPLMFAISPFFFCIFYFISKYIQTLYYAKLLILVL